MKKLLPVLVLAALAAACSQKPAPVTEPAAAPAAEAPAAAAATATPDAVVQQAATASQESAEPASTPNDPSLQRMAGMPESAQLPAGRWQAGKNYRPIVPAQTTNADPGQVEVLEFLWLGCPHCYDLNPYVEAWRKKLPPYVKFSQLHVTWGDARDQQARLFFTLEVMGRDDLVAKAFDEIHRRGNNLLGANAAASQQLHVTFAVANGVNRADFEREYNGFAVNTRMQRAGELTRRYRIDSVPTAIVNGKYRTDAAMAGGNAELTQLLSDLAAAEKSR
jgi:protein dithiol oxidoreductase (disulfide-forming)